MASVAELELEVAATRERLSATIDRIQDKLTVSGMVDEFMGQAGVPAAEQGHDLVLGLLRRHPLPVMIAAAGLGFLIYRMNRGEARGLGRSLLGDDEIVEVAAVNDGQVRVYDPDRPTRHPIATERLQPGRTEA